MKSQISLKISVLLISFFVNYYYVIANDTIIMIKSCAGWELDKIIASLGEPFTVNYGDGTIKKFIGTGEYQSLAHEYPMGTFRITIKGDTEDCKFTVFYPDRVDSLDLSKCPSIKRIGSNSVCGLLRSINTSNCTNLEVIFVGINKLSVLDLRDNIALKCLFCYENQLTHIDFGVKKMEQIRCSKNHFTLSDLYTFSEMVDDPFGKQLGHQNLFTQRIAVGDSVDFSDQKEFGEIATDFYIAKREEWASQEDCQETEGVITFYKSGNYRVFMTNDAIINHPHSPQPVVAAPFQVIDFVPVTEILDVPTETTAGVLLNLYLKGTVIPNNATYKTIVWSVKDAGTTGATITASKLYTTSFGMAIITATIKDGSKIGMDYTQNFTIEVKSLGVHEPKDEVFNIKVYPNPTTGELEFESDNLIINKIEVFDIKGKIVLSHHFSILSAHHRIDISNLNSGTYFVKVFTEQDEIIKKVVKL
jgi:hypothetical protein